MRATILLTIFLFGGIALFGQVEMQDEDYTIKDNQASLKRIWKRAQKEHQTKNYDDALGLYEVLAIRDSSNINFLYEVASLADTLGALLTAEQYFAKAVEHENRTNYPTLDYQYAKVLQTLGHYDQAIRYSQRFRQEQNTPDNIDPAFMTLASQLEEECKAAKRIIEEQPSLYSDIKNVGDPVNDRFEKTSDFAPYQDNGELYFSRLKYRDNVKKEIKELKIYKHRPEEIGVNPAIKTDDQNAYLAFSSDGQHLYEIDCADLNKKFGNRRCKIYRRDLIKGSWSRKRALPNTINLEGYSNTQPAIGIDENGNDVLFFASNRPGGKGKMDIWSAVVNKDEDGYLSYEDPINVSDVNSEVNEISPYFHSKCNALYFSSDRKPSIGGFDIYQASYNGRGYERIESLGYPINSSFDDIDFFRSVTGDKAFFASKRVSEADKENPIKGCCLDIYEANLEMPVDLNLTAYCGTDRISGVDYTIESMRSKGAKIAIDTSGKLDVPIRLKPNEEYQFNISKDNFTTAKFDLLTNEVCEPTQLFERVYIRPLQNLTIDVQGKDIGKTVALDSINIKVKDAEGGYLIDEVENAQTSEVKFSVDTDRTYILEISREGYEGDTTTVIVPSVKESCTTKTSVILNPEIPKLPLPAEIYFHNAIPSIQTYGNLGFTNISYQTTYDSYLDFIPTYKDSLKTYYEARGEIVEADKAEQRVDKFFNEKVRVGYEKLELYANAMIKYLQRGNTITVQMQGTASPLATPSYNQYLSERRVNSVKNYLRTYKNGVLAQYIDKQLLIEEKPLGEAKVDDAIRDRMENNREHRAFGVYDPASAELRRVVILRIDADESEQ